MKKKYKNYSYGEEFTVDTLFEQRYKLRCEHIKNIQQLKIINSIGKEFETWKERNEYAKKSLIAQLDELELVHPYLMQWGPIFTSIMQYYEPKIGYARGDYYNYPEPPPTPHITIAFSAFERGELFRKQISMAYDLGMNVLPIEASIMAIPMSQWLGGWLGWFTLCEGEVR